MQPVDTVRRPRPMCLDNEWSASSLKGDARGFALLSKGVMKLKGKSDEIEVFQILFPEEGIILKVA